MAGIVETPRRGSPPLLIFGLAAALLGLWLFIVTDAADRVDRSFPGFAFWDSGVLASFHLEQWTGPVAGLPLNGGRILRVNGLPFRGGNALLEEVAAHPPGTPFLYEIETGSGATLQTRVYSVPSMRMSGADFVLTYGNYALNALSCMVIALVSLLLRPDDRGSRGLAVMTLSAGLILLLAIDYLSSYRFVRAYELAEASLPPAIAYFAMNFPSKGSRPWSVRWTYALLAAWLVLFAGHATTFYSQPQLAHQAMNVGYVLGSLALIAMFAKLGHGVKHARDPLTRTQSAIVLAGSLFSFLLPAIAVLAFSTIGWTISFTWITALVFCFPLSVLFAIVRYDLFQAERFIRLATGYFSVTGLLVVVFAAATLATRALLSPEAASSPIVSFIALLISALAFDPVRRYAQRAVDRIFFRSSFEPERVLETFGSDLLTMSDPEQIRRHLSATLQTTLDLEWVDCPPEPGRQDTAAAESLRYLGHVLTEVACGPKRSGAPFSAAERELISGMSSQTALALHNAQSIRELKATHDALLRSERFAAIGQLAGSVAHGIRNPLSGIRGEVQLAKEVAPQDVAEMLERALWEVNRLEGRVRSLLDFSRPFEPRFEDVALADIVAPVLRAVERQAQNVSVEIESEIEPRLGRIVTDPSYLEEVLLELATNALRAMPQGGRLTVRATLQREEWVIRVRDTGTGVPEGVRERVFELFFTTRDEGTGIGLASVKKIVESLGGRVALEASSGVGSEFRIDLPMSPPASHRSV